MSPPRHRHRRSWSPGNRAGAAARRRAAPTATRYRPPPAASDRSPPHPPTGRCARTATPRSRPGRARVTSPSQAGHTAGRPAPARSLAQTSPARRTPHVRHPISSQACGMPFPHSGTRTRRPLARAQPGRCCWLAAGQVTRPAAPGASLTLPGLRTDARHSAPGRTSCRESVHRRTAFPSPLLVAICSRWDRI